jgi:hypothetical protein
LKAEIKTILASVGDFSRFKNLFLTNFLNKFEQIKHILDKKNSKILTLTQENTDLQLKCKEFDKNVAIIQDLNYKISELTDML